jgi:hypothetical protein
MRGSLIVVTPVVDRDRFLLLAAMLASTTCGEPRPASAPPRAASNITLEVPEPQADGDELNACDNDDVGEIDCSAIARHEVGPTCEGLAGGCELLAKGYGYKRRIGAEIAKCWERLGRGACNITARERCNLQGVQSACTDRRFEPQCQAALDRCTAARVRVGYTLAECMQVLSSLDDANRDWALGAMGPAAEGCRPLVPVY